MARTPQPRRAKLNALDPMVRRGPTRAVASAKDQRRAKKSELVAHTLANELFLGQVPTGSVIDVEEDLVDRLNVSRATLREALRLLEILGLVESRMGRTGGVAVRQPNADDFARIITFYLQFTTCTYRDLIKVYIEALPAILAGAVRESTEEQRAELRTIMAQYTQLELGDQVRQVQEIIARFIGMLQNPIWVLCARSIHSVVSSQFELLLVPESEWPVAVRTVMGMAEAVLDGDEERARRLARRQAEAWLVIAESYQADLLRSRIRWESSGAAAPPI